VNKDELKAGVLIGIGIIATIYLLSFLLVTIIG